MISGESLARRVASVLRDYGLNERAEAPADSKALHDEGGVTW